MIQVNRYELSNGLRLVHSEDNATQMVVLNVLYDVGSRDESPEHTGFAHLFEHLMFGGSVNIPDYDTPVQMAGGENNAWTNTDLTNYYVTLPWQNAEVGFWLESDRMLSLAFTPKSLEIQRQVVIEEFKQRCLNKPFGDVGHLLRELVYTKHPYQWPTIGKDISHIQEATLDQVKDFFFRFYAPNNAVLAVAGHISFERAVELAEKWFGGIDRRDIKQRNLPVEPLQTSYRRREVDRNVPVDGLYLAFPMCSRRHEDYFAYDMLSDILSNGKSSRLIRQLVHEHPVFSSIDASILGCDDPGYLQVVGKPLPGVSLQNAEDAVFDVLQQVAEQPIDEQELEKVKNKFESTQIFQNLNVQQLAHNLAYFEVLGDASAINQEVEAYRKVSEQQLRRVAMDTFCKKRANVLYYHSVKP